MKYTGEELQSIEALADVVVKQFKRLHKKGRKGKKITTKRKTNI